MRLEGAIKTTQLACGGPGSGRKPVHPGLHSALLEHGFAFQSNTRDHEGNTGSLYTHPRMGRVFTQSNGLWEHEDAGKAVGGQGVSNLGFHLKKI